MEESLRQLWVVCIWFFGISTTVTITFFGWLSRIQSRISVGDDIKKDLDRMSQDVAEIKDALKGDYEKPGIITKHYELEKRIEVLERG